MDTALEKLDGVFVRFEASRLGRIVILQAEMFSMLDQKRLDELLALHSAILR